MPRSRRQVQSDSEEDDTQMAGPSTSNAGASSSRRVAKSRPGNASRKAVKDAKAAPPASDEEGEGGRIDVRNFSDQPLRNGDASKVQGFGRDWVEIERKVKKNWEMISNTATALADAADGDDAEKVFQRTE
jgi:hypothetical protein